MACLCRYQCYSTIQTPLNTERLREKQKGLVKQTFELDEAATAERQDEQVRSCYTLSLCYAVDGPNNKLTVVVDELHSNVRTSLIKSQSEVKAFIRKMRVGSKHIW